MRLKLKKTGLSAALAAAFAAGAGSAGAAGFALIEQSGSGMGNAYAGAAAVAEDASTVFFNPAGMSLLEGPQFAAAAHVISLSAKFSGTANNPAALGVGPATGGSGGDAGDAAVVPNLYFTMPVGERLTAGLGIGVPFGLVTEYDANWVGRFQGIKSEIMTLNINPSIAYKVSDTISVGGGINYQQLDAELTNAAITALGEGLTKLEADDDAWGWNLGVLFNVGPATRIGIAYRSELDYELQGNAVTTANINGSVQDSFAAKADATLPDSFSISLAHALNDRLQILADATLTNWSSIQTIVIRQADGTQREELNLNFDDSWRYSIGVNYKYSDQLTLKAGVAYDETPVKNAQSRTVRIPDNDRTWISLGGQMKVGQRGRVDLGYSHLFIDDADIDFTREQFGFPVPGASATTVQGTYEGSVDIFSIQYTHSF